MRKMIEANVNAFKNLIEKFTTIAPEYNVGEGKRYIKTTDDEKEWLQTLTILDKIRLLPTLGLVTVKHKDELYVIIHGNIANDINIDNDVATEFQINSGLFTVLLSEADIKFNQGFSRVQFYDEILFQHTQEGYKGHDQQDILPFLENILVFNIPHNSVLYNVNIYRIATYFISKDKSNILLQFEAPVIELFSDLSLMGSDKISYENLLNSMLSSNFKHSFLELYRLVERLFPIKYLKDLHGKVNTNLSFLEFVSSIEDVTSWRPKEDEAVEKIFDNTKASAANIIQGIIQGNAKYHNFSNSTFFYKLRNSIVHFRAGHQDTSLSNSEWNLLIRATLEIIDQHYSENSKVL